MDVANGMLRADARLMMDVEVVMQQYGPLLSGMIGVVILKERNSMENEKCELCHYYRLSIIETSVCKRFPIERTKKWFDWCGEFKKKEHKESNLITEDPIEFTPTADSTKRRGRPRNTDTIKQETL